jgi:hypothetical protein
MPENKFHNISGKDAVAKGYGKGIPDFELLHFGGYKRARREYLKALTAEREKEGGKDNEKVRR